MRIDFVQDIIDVLRRKKNIIDVLKRKNSQIQFLVFWSGTKCSLKCKNCSNLIPYIEQKSFDAQECINDLKKLLKYKKIKIIQLQGGEIFTHPEAAKFINEINKLNIDSISLTTNGTVIPKEEVLQAIKNNPNMTVTISNYDCAKQSREKLIKVFEEREIKYTIYNFAHKDNTWFKTGEDKEVFQSEEKGRQNYDICLEKYCLTLANGILYSCGKIMAINELYEVKNETSSMLNIRNLARGGGIKKVS